MNFLAPILMVFALVMGVNSAHAECAEGDSAILFNFGFTGGGMAIGIDYEHGYDRTFGIGGYFRMYPDDDSPQAPGITTFGAFIRPHFNRQNWDFSVAPGFGIMDYEPTLNRDDETLLGPSLMIGLLYELNSKISVGVEHMTMASWFGDKDYRGNISEEILAKFRMVFN